MALEIRKTRATCKLTVLFIPELCDTRQHPADQSLCVIQGERYPGLSVSGEQSRVTAKHSLGFALAQWAPFDFIPTIEINIDAVSDCDSCDEQVWEQSVLPRGGGGEGRENQSLETPQAGQIEMLWKFLCCLGLMWQIHGLRTWPLSCWLWDEVTCLLHQLLCIPAVVPALRKMPEPALCCEILLDSLCWMLAVLRQFYFWRDQGEVALNCSVFICEMG